MMLKMMLSLLGRSVDRPKRIWLHDRKAFYRELYRQIDAAIAKEEPGKNQK